MSKRQKSTQDQQLLCYNENDKNGRKQDLRQHFKRDDIQQSWPTCCTVLNDHVDHLSITLDHTLKFEEFLRRRSQAEMRKEKRPIVSQPSHQFVIIHLLPFILLYVIPRPAA